MLTASPGLRVAAARGWGQCALLAGDPGSAVEGYTAAIELLPLVAWHGLDQATREHHLREWAGLASDAAAAAVAAGDPARAVELLEAGRSMLWTQALHLRQDLAALQERAPGLAAVLEASRAVLNSLATSLIRDPDTAGDVDQVQAAEQRMLEERRRAARDWDAAVDQIRRIEGFEHFLRPVPFTDLRAAASGGPVVIVNISRHGSHALIVTPATGPNPDPAVLVVDLPAAPMDTVIDQANTLLGALAQGRRSRHGLAGERGRPARGVQRPGLVLAGDHRTGPDRPRPHAHSPGKDRGLAAGVVVPDRTGDGAAVARRGPPPPHHHPVRGDGRGGRPRRQRGRAGDLLLHPDPDHPDPGPHPARTRPGAAAGRRGARGPQLCPGASPLPAVPAELQVLARYLPTPEHATHLLGPAATRQAVLEALPGHSWLHLSCHGVQHPADASLSAFLLHDQPLTLADLAALNLRETDLAYLAACQTATGDLRLLDEALHLAGALQLVGYRHVLATLWSISDAAAPAMADITYAHLLHPDPDHPSPADRPQAARAPYALHHAVTRLRQACPGEPLLWAPYIHLGP